MKPMLDSSLFDACLLNPGNWISAKQPTQIMHHAHIQWMAQKHTESITQLIYRILHAQGSRIIGTGPLSSRRCFRCNRGPARSGCPEAETPDRSMRRTDEGEIWSSRSFMQLHTPRANQLLALIQVPSFHLRPLPFASPHLPSFAPSTAILFSSSEPQKLL